MPRISNTKRQRRRHAVTARASKAKPRGSSCQLPVGAGLLQQGAGAIQQQMQHGQLYDDWCCQLQNSLAVGNDGLSACPVQATGINSSQELLQAATPAEVPAATQRRNNLLYNLRAGNAKKHAVAAAAAGPQLDTSISRIKEAAKFDINLQVDDIQLIRCCKPGRHNTAQYGYLLVQNALEDEQHKNMHDRYWVWVQQPGSDDGITPITAAEFVQCAGYAAATGKGHKWKSICSIIKDDDAVGCSVADWWNYQAAAAAGKQDAVLQKIEQLCDGTNRPHPTLGTGAVAEDVLMADK